LNRLLNIPASIWEALKVAFDFLSTRLRGRHLEAELAKAKVREQTEKSKVHSARNWGARVVYEENAARAAAEAKELEAEAALLEHDGAAERKRIEELKGPEIHKEYLRLVERAKERARE
jgi:hypothetical protein